MAASLRCQFWLPKKKRFCANASLHNSSFCGNHTERSNHKWIPCPIDPSHPVLQDNLENHLTRCPFLKQAQSLSLKPYYQKGINAGSEEDGQDDTVKQLITSEMKRLAVHHMTLPRFFDFIGKIKTIHATICNHIQDSFTIPEAFSVWTNRQVDRRIPFQEKHVLQQASILGNLEQFGLLENSGVDVNAGTMHFNDVPAVVEFGAGRGYLTQLLADCYGIKKVLLVERKSYKLKADRSLRQIESMTLERLRIDIEDLNLNAVESLQGVTYLAIGKHLCGPATDKKYMSNLGLTKEDFHAITWFTSWAVDARHGSDLYGIDGSQNVKLVEKGEFGPDSINESGVGDVVRNMSVGDRAVLGFMCKDIIDAGRWMWLQEHGLKSQIVKYVPASISPENHLLVAARRGS